jgi:hypothetical protein
MISLYCPHSLLTTLKFTSAPSAVSAVCTAVHYEDYDGTLTLLVGPSEGLRKQGWKVPVHCKLREGLQEGCALQIRLTYPACEKGA